MNILVIHGSMREGNTYHLTRKVTDKLRNREDVIMNEIKVSDLDLPFCKSCHVCFKEGEAFCPHRDVVEEVSSALEACDGVILSGVVYSLHLNAAMKNVIDHLSYYFHRPSLFDKKGMVVTTTAGAAEKTVAKYLKDTINQWGICNVEQLSCKIQTDPFSLTLEQKERIDQAAATFYASIFYHRDKAPSLKTLAVHNAFRAMSTAAKGVSECDRTYWEETGLGGKVYPKPINVFKRAAGSLIYRGMNRIFRKDKS